MSGNYKDSKTYWAVGGSNNNLSILPKDSRTIIVLLSVLERIYERNRSLVGNYDLVLKKPGATDDS